MSSIQIGYIESFYLWDVFWFVVLKHFKHKNCLILIKIFKSIYGSNLYKFKPLYTTSVDIVDLIFSGKEWLYDSLWVYDMKKEMKYAFNEIWV